MQKLLHILSITILLLFLFLLFFHPITAITQDLGRHLLTGEIILQTHHVPRINLFSYTYPTFPFINHHWLSEVVFYGLQTHIGFRGLLLITTLIVVFAWMLQLFFLRKHANILALLLSSLLYLLILSERTDVRPEIFSFLFLSLFIVILYKNREHFTRWIFLLIPMELIWVNMHIYFFVGIMVVFLFFLDYLLYYFRHKYPPSNEGIKESHLHSPEGNGQKSSHILTFSLLAGMMLLIPVINPNGINGALYPLHIFQNYGYSIEENQSIFFLDSIMLNLHILYFKIAAVVLFLCLCFTGRKTKPIDWFLSITFIIFAASAIRNFPLFVFATFIPFLRSFSLLIENGLSYLERHYSWQKKYIQYGLTVFLLGINLFFIGNLFIEKRVGYNLISGAQPAADFYLAHDIQGPVFNNFDIGSYLEYRLYPKQRVFVDGRPEAYPATFFEQVYKPMQVNPNIFATIDTQYHFNSIFFSHTDQTPWAEQFMHAIGKNPQWTPVYIDDTIIIFLKKNQENKTLIQKFAIDSHTYSLRVHTLDSLNALAHIFNELGWQDQELATYQSMLAINSHYCPALSNALIILNEKPSPLLPLYTSLYTVSCK